MIARVQTLVLWAIVLTCVALSALAVFSSSTTFSLYRRDVENNRQYCEAEGEREERQNTKECQGVLYRTLDDPVAFFTAALTFATIALFLVTFGLFFYASRQASEARAAVALAGMTAERQLRAYVGISRIHLRHFSHVAPISVGIEIKNFGATPAHDYQTALWLEVQQYPVPWPGAFVRTDSASTNSASSLMPGNKSVVICGLPNIIPAEFVAGIRAETLALYLCGTIRYRDVFEKEQRTDVRKLARGPRMETESPFIDAPEGNHST